MPIISALKDEGRKRRVTLYIDGAPALDLSRESVADAGLRAGETIDEARIAEVVRRDRVRSAVQRAGRLLEIRPRASHELAIALKQRGFDDATIDEALGRLKELGLIDDSQFAVLFIESRTRSRPQALRMSRSELWARGVDKATVDEAVAGMGDVDDLPQARAALGKKARSLPTDKDERRAAYQRMSGFLARRGFGWDVVKKALAEIFDPDEVDG